MWREAKEPRIGSEAAGIEDAENGFTLQFSDRPFPGVTTHLRKTRFEYGGWWYALDETGMEAWFGEPLLIYFPDPPETIYAQARRASRVTKEST